MKGSWEVTTLNSPSIFRWGQILLIQNKVSDNRHMLKRILYYICAWQGISYILECPCLANIDCAVSHNTYLYILSLLII